MKEFFDQLRGEAERHELPQPAELRARGDRRTARRGAAGAFSLAVMMAGGFIAAKPLFQEPSITADAIASSPATILPETIAVPNVVGMSRTEATTVLQQQGFKVEVKSASPPPSGSPQGGKVRQQDPVGARLIPSETTVTIYVEPSETQAVCADKYPKQLPASLYPKTDSEICYADADPLTTWESLPMPCVPKVLTSDSLIEDRRGFSAVFDVLFEKGHVTTALDQTITKYFGTGAKDYLTELTGDVSRCTSATHGDATLAYSLVQQTQQDKLGEQSLLINVTRRYLEKPESGPQVADFLISVVRVGLYVIVVYDKGWEGTPRRTNAVVDTAREMLGRLTASPSPSR